MDIAELALKVDTTDLPRAQAAFETMRDRTVRAANDMDVAVAKVEGALKSALRYFGIYQFASWVKGSIDLAARYDTLGVVISRIGKQAGHTEREITLMTRGLQRQGISMNESRQSLVRMINAKMDLTRAEELARVAQDAAVIANVNSSEAFRRLIHGIETANPTILRNVGINVLFSEAYAKTAAQLGKNVNQLSAYEKVQARTEAVIKNATQVAGSYEAAMGTAGKQVGSMARYVEDLRVKLGSAFQPAYTTVVFALANVVKFLADNLTVVGPLVAALSARFALLRVATDGNANAIKTMAANVVTLFTAQRDKAEADMDAAQVARELATTEVDRIGLHKQQLAALGQIHREERERIVTMQAQAQQSLVNAKSEHERALATIRLEGATTMLATADEKAAMHATMLGVANDELRGALLAQSAATVRATVATTAYAKAKGVLAMASAGVLGGLQKMYALLGGGWGIALMAATALISRFSMQHTKAAQELTDNTDTIDEEMKRLNQGLYTSLESSERWKNGLGATAAELKTLTAQTNNYRKQVDETNAVLERARERVLHLWTPLDRVKTLLSVWKTDNVEFSLSMNRLQFAFEDGELSATDYYAELEKLQLQYPGYREQIQQVQKALALLHREQRDGAKVLAELEPPLIRQVKLLNAFTEASAQAAQAQEKWNTVGPRNVDLGDFGREVARDNSDTRRREEAIKRGGTEALELINLRIQAERNVASEVTRRLRVDEALAAVTNMTSREMRAYVAENKKLKDGLADTILEIADFQDAAIFNAEQALLSARAVSELSESLGKTSGTAKQAADALKSLVRARELSELPASMREIEESYRSGKDQIAEFAKELGASHPVLVSMLQEVEARRTKALKDTGDARALDDALQRATMLGQRYVVLQLSIQRFRNENKEMAADLAALHVAEMTRSYERGEAQRAEELRLLRLRRVASGERDGSGVTNEARAALTALDAERNRLVIRAQLARTDDDRLRIEQQITELDNRRKAIREQLGVIDTNALALLSRTFDATKAQAQALQEMLTESLNAMTQSFTQFFQRVLIEGKATFADLGKALLASVLSMLSGIVAMKIGTKIQDALFGAVGADGARAGGLFGARGYFAQNPNAARTVAGVGIAIGAGAAGYQSASPLGGAFSGATTGALAGAALGPLGAVAGGIIGGVSGLVGGLLGSSAKAKEAAKQMAEARATFTKALDEYVKAATDNTTALGRTLQQMRTETDGLVQAAYDTLGGNKSGLQAGAVKRFFAEGLARGDDASSMYFGDSDPMTQELRRLFTALQTAIRREAKKFTDGLQDEFLRSTGRGTEADLAAIEAQRAESTRSLNEAYAQGALTLGQLITAQYQLTVVMDKRKQDVLDAAQRELEAFNRDVQVRQLRAEGREQDAIAMERQAQYEEEVRVAREAGRDVTQLLIAQEMELAQIRAQEAEAARRRTSALDVRAMRARGNELGAELAEEAEARRQAIADAEREFGAESPYVAHLRAVLALEEGAAFAARRRTFAAEQRAMDIAQTANPVEQARLQGEDVIAEARAKYGALFDNAIITAEEYAQAMDRVNQSVTASIALAKERQAADAAAFAVQLAQLRAQSDPADRALAKTAFLLEATTRYDQLLDNAKKLRDAGTITDEQFADMAEVLAKTFGPAALETQWTLQEAARLAEENAAAFRKVVEVLNANLSHLRQEWDVFGADAIAQVRDLRRLFGFEGMTDEAVRALYTRMQPGEQLTEAQKALNDVIAAFLTARRQEDAFLQQQQAQAQQEATAAAEQAAKAQQEKAPGVSVHTTSSVLSGADVVQPLTRIASHAAQQTAVLRRIDARLAAALGGGVSSLPAPATDQALGQALTTDAQFLGALTTV